jgi:nicotinamidase-related amidase
MRLLESSASQLAVVDVQERLGAVMPAKVINRVINNSSLLLRAASMLTLPVTASEQYPQGLGSTIDTVRAVMPAAATMVEKTCFSAGAVPAFAQALASHGRKQIVLVGMEAHVCVLQSAFDLRDAGYEVFVVEDAICSRKLENYQNALERIRDGRITLVSAESVIFEWLRDARHEHFKALSALIR